MKKSGFTLVELLVVILIIAILATIGLVMYGSVQKRARIAKRIEDLKAIQVALELYYAANKTYPVSTSWTACNTAPSGLLPYYMPAYPSDPQSGGCYRYTSSSSGQDYKIQNISAPEMANPDYKSQPNFIDPARDGGTDCKTIDGALTNITGWAVYTTNTGFADATLGTGNPACWN